MDIVEKAALFAETKHKGQRRKYTFEPYVEHPKRVAHRVSSIFSGDDVAVCAALLHDTIEDTDTSFSELEQEFGNKIASMVLELTNEKWFWWDRKIRKEYQRGCLAHVSIEAKIIKCADIEDNIGSIREYDKKFYPVYLEESRLLVKAMQKQIKLPCEISLFFRATARLEEYFSIFKRGLTQSNKTTPHNKQGETLAQPLM